MKSKKILHACIAAILACVFTALPVQAHQSPGSCNSNRLTLSIAKNKTTVQPGDTITYTVTLSNVDVSTLIACDIDNATVEVVLPGHDGQPNGTVISLATNANYAAGTALTAIGTVPYVVNVDANVIDVVAEVHATGALHDAPINHTANITKTIGTAIVRPPVVPPATPPSTPTPSTPTSTTTYPKLPNAGIVRG
jgi:uncharacterized repeat protein (TIGR01451 family)